jgi:chromosome segregation ATPase
MKTSNLVLLLAGALALGGCRSTYYSVYEKFGVYKRDLLKKDVVKARDGQKQAQEQFKDALTRLKELTGFQGGELEKHYNGLKKEYDQCVSKANDVHDRVKEVETVAADLFAEWEKENGQITTPSLRESSQQQLKTTRQKYEDLHRSLKAAEETLDPVLKRFNDYVLYLKHSLNAQAIASLKGEAQNIQTDISQLIDQMNRSIAHADEFIKAME